MKHSSFIVFSIAAFLVGLAGHVAADLSSLRGAEAVPTTLAAPKLMRFINDKENVERTFDDQPPLTPHTNEKYTINLQTNKCLDCHMKQPGKDEAKSVEMSESHFIGRDGVKLDRLAGGRHFCTQCHVPQVDAKPLIGSNFQTVK